MTTREMGESPPSFGEAFTDMMKEIDRPDKPGRLAVSNVQVNVRIPTAYHRVLKLRAARDNTTMTEIVVELISDYVHGR